MDLTPIFLDRLEISADLVRNIKPAQLDDDTPCSGWDVRALVNHFLGGQLGFALALDGSRPLDPTETPPDLLAEAGDDPAAAVDPIVEQARASWTTPGALDQESIPVGGGLPARSALRIALAEAVVHGWDIATATHQAYEIPPPLAEQMLEGMRKVFGDGPREPGGFFGPIVEVPEDASPADRLMGFLGRTP